MCADPFLLGCWHQHITGCCVCSSVAWQCLDRAAAETRLGSSPAPAGSLLLWEEAGTDSLAQVWQHLLLLPAQQVLWGGHVGSARLLCNLTAQGGDLPSPSLETESQPPHAFHPREPSCAAGGAQCPGAELGSCLSPCGAIHSKHWLLQGRVCRKRICVAGGDNLSNWTLSASMITCQNDDFGH